MKTKKKLTCQLMQIIYLFLEEKKRTTSIALHCYLGKGNHHLWKG